MLRYIQNYRRFKFRVVLVLLVGAADTWLDLDHAAAGGLYLNEFATPSMGVAGAGQQAYADDASTAFAYHNPAGMTRLEGSQVSAGAGLLNGTTKFDADSNSPFSGGNGGDQAGLAPFLGTHGVYDLAEDIKLGMSIFSVSGAALDPDNSWTGRYQLQDIELLTLTANPSLAFQATDWLSLGAGFQAMYASLDYKLAIPPVNPPNGGNSQAEVDGDDWAFGYNFGALFELSPQTRIGVTYVSKIEPEFDGDLKVKGPLGKSSSVNSNIAITFPQSVKVGAYHEVNTQWALLGSVGWEDWSSFDSFELSTNQGGSSVDTNWKDTYQFSGGVHYKPTEDWLLQAGITYDTSPVSDGNRQAMLPSDRQIRYAAGVQHQLTESLNVGGAFEFIDLGDAEIKSNSLRGEYSTNRVFAFALNMNYKF